MTIIEISALYNGAHSNQTIPGADPATFPVPEGWAVLPAGMETLNFPFGDLTVDGSVPPVVTSWTPGTIPDPEPEPEAEPTEAEDVAALVVDHEYRLTLLELGLTEEV